MRSLLFAPATRPELVAKLGRAGPDAAVVDLEDAVPAAHKAAARGTAREAARALAADHPDLRVYVRVNAPGSGLLADDVREAVTPGLAGVVVPKAESAEQLAAVRELLGAAHGEGLGIVAGVETARGVADVDDLLDPDLHAVYFGAEDFAADVGARRTAAGHEVLYARSRVVLAARLAGVPALDQAVVAIRDDEAFREDAQRGRELGYRGKLCVHPAQVALAHEAFSPTEAEVDLARRVLSAWEETAATGAGALEVDGVMVDEPALRFARATLAAAGAG